MKYIDRFPLLLQCLQEKLNLFTFYTLLHHQKVYFSTSNLILNAPSLTKPINKIVN